MQKYGNVIGITLISLGLFFLIQDYLLEKKNKAIENMKLLLLETQTEAKTTFQVEELNEQIDENTQVEIVQDETNYIPEIYYYIGFLEIPKINLKKGFLEIDNKDNNINKNVTVHEFSNYPNIVNGNFILVAHSGSAYISFFKNLYKLDINDLAYVYYDDYKYTYQISDIYIVDKTGTVNIKRDYDKTTLTLITCTYNDDYHQTVYVAYLIEKEEI